MKTWAEHYAGRNCDSYRAYFENKYKRFLEIIEAQGCTRYLEAGCGISTVSKLLKQRASGHIVAAGFDKSIKMLSMGGYRYAQRGDMFDMHQYEKYKKPYLIHSHGVLEHFGAWAIVAVGLMRETGCPMVHWVPTDANEKPSRGDELLLSPKDWATLLQPDDYYVVDKGFIGVWKG